MRFDDGDDPVETGIIRAVKPNRRSQAALPYCHRHNLVRKQDTEAERCFGIRVTLPSGDTFARIFDQNWENVHWYPTEEDRDRAFDRMAAHHGYYRASDSPSQVLEKIVR